MNTVGTTASAERLIVPSSSLMFIVISPTEAYFRAAAKFASNTCCASPERSVVSVTRPAARPAASSDFCNSSSSM